MRRGERGGDLGSGCHGLQIEWEARVRDAKHGYRKAPRQVRGKRSKKWRQILLESRNESHKYTSFDT